MTRAVGICSWEKSSGNDVPFIEGRGRYRSKKEKRIAREIDIHRDLRRHWNHSTPRAKTTQSRTEMASGRQGLLQPIDIVIGYLKHWKEHIWNRCWCFKIRKFHIENIEIQFSSVQFSRWVVSNSLQSHELQHAMPLGPSLTPGVHSNSHPSSRWCHPAIPSSVVPFSSCPQSPQHQGLFQRVNSSHEVAKVLKFQL